MLFLSFIDPSLGRLDYESLSDQARMEILISPVSEKFQERFKDAHGNFLDACEWEGVTCDADGSIKSILIELSSSEPQALNLSYIPPTVRNFGSCGGQECNFSPETLPPSVLDFGMSFTKISGSIDFKAFSPHMQVIFMLGCGMQGSFDAQALPEKLEKINISGNQLTGSLSLDRLPRPMTVFEAKNNRFSGKLLIDNLPPGMKSIQLMYNDFTTFVLLNTPDRTKQAAAGLRSDFLQICVQESGISGTAVLEKAINGRKVLLDLADNNIEAVVDEEGKEHRLAERILKQQEY